MQRPPTQTGSSYASGYSIATPKPISGAGGRLPQASRRHSVKTRYLGSIPAKSTGTTIRLSLQETIARGLRYNLGLIESEHAIRMSLRQLNGSGPLVRRLLNSRFPFLFCKHLKLNHNTNRLFWHLKGSSEHGKSR